jgi:Ca2+-dependent lipid-binding protein
VIEAKQLKAMDLSGTSDPFVTIKTPSEKFKTEVVKKTLDPKWNEEFVLDIDDQNAMEVCVWDWDLVGSVLLTFVIA